MRAHGGARAPQEARRGDPGEERAEDGRRHVDAHVRPGVRAVAPRAGPRREPPDDGGEGERRDGERTLPARRRHLDAVVVVARRDDDAGEPEHDEPGRDDSRPDGAAVARPGEEDGDERDRAREVGEERRRPGDPPAPEPRAVQQRPGGGPSAALARAGDGHALVEPDLPGACEEDETDDDGDRDEREHDGAGPRGHAREPVERGRHACADLDGLRPLGAGAHAPRADHDDGHRRDGRGEQEGERETEDPHRGGRGLRAGVRHALPRRPDGCRVHGAVLGAGDAARPVRDVREPERDVERPQRARQPAQDGADDARERESAVARHRAPRVRLAPHVGADRVEVAGRDRRPGRARDSVPRVGVRRRHPEAAQPVAVALLDLAGREVEHAVRRRVRHAVDPQLENGPARRARVSHRSTSDVGVARHAARRCYR